MKNKELAIKTIQADCKLQDRYIGSDGATCAIGALVLAAQPDFDLTNADYDLPFLTANRAAISHRTDMLAVLDDYFGLDADACKFIQAINDASSLSQNERREKIVKFIETLPTE